jgi:phosphoglycolate phosphatase
MSRTWIFLDLDGPVLDVSRRYHRVHQDLVERLGGWPFPLTAYWEAKRNLIPETEILERAGLSSEAAQEAAVRRLSDIEGLGYIALDIPWPWTKAALTDLARIAPLALVTLRNNPELLNWQLEVFGLSRHFTRVLSGPGDGTPEAKAALLREAGISWGPESVFIGDTEVDVASGRALGLRTIALGCGIRTPALLERSSPDVLLEDLSQVPGWLAPPGLPA